MNVPSYEQALRAIGQGLEALGVAVFDLAIEGENYVIRGNPVGSRKTERLEPRAIRRAFLTVSKTVKSRFLTRTRTQELSPCSEVTLRFSPKDVETLEREGLDSRSGNSQAPKPHSLPQILRSIGWYIDNKEGRVVKVSVRGHDVRICYSEAFGTEKMEELSLTNIYDIWVRMYKQRKGSFEIRASTFHSP